MVRCHTSGPGGRRFESSRPDHSSFPFSKPCGRLRSLAWIASFASVPSFVIEKARRKRNPFCQEREELEDAYAAAAGVGWRRAGRVLRMALPAGRNCAGARRPPAALQDGITEAENRRPTQRRSWLLLTQPPCRGI